MKQSFIISIFLLIMCIIISQVVYYWLPEVEGISFSRPVIRPIAVTPKPTTPPPMPKFLTHYVSEVITNKYLSNAQIQQIYTSATAANNVAPVRTKSELLAYLTLLKTQLNNSYTPPLPQLAFFSISVPRAFQSFYMPDQKIPVPYNKLHSNMPDIFPNSSPYTQIQMICVNWQQSTLLFESHGPITDPRNDIFNEVIRHYIDSMNESIEALQNFYAYPTTP